MPLISSPIDGSPMRQVVRHGIEIDVCPTTGGVWLDKGELEKLMSLMQDAVDDTEDDFLRFKEAKSRKELPRDYYEPYEDRGYRPSYKKYNDDDYDDYHKYKHGKKNKLKTLLTLFE